MKNDRNRIIIANLEKMAKISKILKNLRKTLSYLTFNARKIFTQFRQTFI